MSPIGWAPGRSSQKRIPPRQNPLTRIRRVSDHPRYRSPQEMTATLTFHPFGNADCTRLDLADGKKMLIDYADMRNRLSEAGYAYETKLRALEHQPMRPQIKLAAKIFAGPGL